MPHVVPLIKAKMFIINRAFLVDLHCMWISCLDEVAVRSDHHLCFSAKCSSKWTPFLHSHICILLWHRQMGQLGTVEKVLQVLLLLHRKRSIRHPWPLCPCLCLVCKSLKSQSQFHPHIHPPFITTLSHVWMAHLGHKNPLILLQEDLAEKLSLIGKRLTQSF